MYILNPETFRSSTFLNFEIHKRSPLPKKKENKIKKNKFY